MGLWVYLCVAGIDGIHFSLKFSHVFSSDWQLFVFVFLEEHGEHVGHGLTIGVAHGEGGSIDAFGHQLKFQQVAAAIATDDAANFPEADVVEELTAGDAYLAHEQLIDVAGGT